MKLLVATTNQGKKAEYQELLAELDLDLVSLLDLGIAHDVEETGSTFEENALIKAVAYASEACLLTLADDSGLEVDALAGAPGIRSARYGEPGFDDKDRYRLLLHNLRDVPDESRTARFRCAIALVWPDGRQVVVDGTCEGMITRTPRGDNGFGYDPVFYVPEYGRTMAELPAEIKNRISHRAHAAIKVVEVLALLG